MLEFRLRMYLLGRNVRWMVIALAAGTIWFGGPHRPISLAAVYAMLALASGYNLALYVLPWRALEEQGKGNWVAVPYVVCDSFCISVLIYVTGRIDSNFFLAYLLLVVWMAVYPGMRLRPWLWMIVVVSYAVVVFRGTPFTVQIGFSLLMRTVIFAFVAWLANSIAGELFAATAKLDNTVRELTDGVVAIDRDGRVILLNPRAAELLSVPQSAALGALVSDAASPPALRQLVTEPNAASVSLRERQVRLQEIVMGEDPERVVRVYTADYVDEMGEPAGELKVLHDVSDLKQLERLRAEVMSAVTHDLGNPLEIVKGILVRLRRRLAAVLDDDCRRWLHTAEEENDRLLRLTREMLDLARMDAGRLRLNLAPVGLDQEIGKVVGTVARQAQELHLALTAEVDPDLPPVSADADRVARILHNLVGNALKFTPRGGAITIHAGPCPEDAGMAQISVSDTGPGVPPDKLEAIFDRFVQVGDELRPKTRGSGLGLPICRDLVAAHNGRLWVESQPGRGSTFLFTLPLARDQ